MFTESPETAIQSAFRRAGTTDRDRLLAAFSVCAETKAPPLALWNRLKADKPLALLAMNMLLSAIGREVDAETSVARKRKAAGLPQVAVLRAEKIKQAAASIATEVERAVIKRVLDAEKASDGRPWGDVGYHELPAMERDGAIAHALLKELPSPRNHFAPLRELTTDGNFAALLRRVRGQDNGATGA